MKGVTLALACLLVSNVSIGDPLTYVREGGSGRVDFGWDGSGGGNLEAYSKDATGSYEDRKGQFKFIYGGYEGEGKIFFTYYNGSGWDNKVVIMPNGDVITKGTMKATQMVVDEVSQIWPDYVFEKSYSLMPITDLKTFIEEKGHLPGIPTAEEVEANGNDLGLMSAKTLEKVEELTVYVIQLKEENDALKQDLEQMRKRLDEIQ